MNVLLETERLKAKDSTSSPTASIQRGDSRPRCNIRSPTKQPTVALDDTDTNAVCDCTETDAKNKDRSQSMQIYVKSIADSKFVDMLRRGCRLIIHHDVKHDGCGYTERMFQNKNFVSLHTSITKPVTA